MRLRPAYLLLTMAPTLAFGSTALPGLQPSQLTLVSTGCTSHRDCKAGRVCAAGQCRNVMPSEGAADSTAVPRRLALIDQQLLTLDASKHSQVGGIVLLGIGGLALLGAAVFSFVGQGVLFGGVVLIIAAGALLPLIPGIILLLVNAGLNRAIERQRTELIAERAILLASHPQPGPLSIELARF